MKKIFFNRILACALIVFTVFCFYGCSKHEKNPTPVLPDPTIGLTATVTTFAGSGALGSANGIGAAASFCAPIGVAIDAKGNLYVLDEGQPTVRKITPDGTVTTYAGTGVQGSAIGAALSSSFDTPQAIAVDPAGNVYIGDQGGGELKKITPDGTVSNLILHDAKGAAFSFESINGLVSDAGGDIFVADYTRIDKITPDGAASILTPGDLLPVLGGIAFDSSGNLYTAGGNEILKISPAGAVTVLAGSAAGGKANGTGPKALFYYPSGVAVDAKGNVYVTDSQNGLIRMVSPEGAVGTLAGGNPNGNDLNGIGTAASFVDPVAITIDASGNLYVAEVFGNLVRKIVITKSN